MEETSFALDIGTRGVTGILYRATETGCEIKSVYSQEHADRAMQDGQIHDIAAVARVIGAVRSKLEHDTGQSLSRVSVAAAGRALRTLEVHVTAPMQGVPCTEADVYHLQLLAVQTAKEQLRLTMAAEASPDRLQSPELHCVGYSVRHYFLDKSPIVNLVAQRGQEVGVALIATFLPRVVVDSLDAALTEAGLVMQGLTLEPIAALNALVPASMRKLNIALVDIGAGTSDIALTADGTVLAYGMVPTAGDEITETLAELLLLDFPVAEQLKRQLLSQGRLSFPNVLGVQKTLSSRKILALIAPAIVSLATAIAAEILRLNRDHAPAAVMVIGGGAKTPFIEQHIAHALDLAHDRVRMRGRESMPNIHGCEDVLTGPEAVTPIGIALAASYSEITPLSVTVERQTMRLFAFHPLTVGDALVEAGVTLRSLKLRTGAALVVEVNGQIRSLPGTLGTPGGLLKNGLPTDLNDILLADDTLQVTQAVPGQNAQGVMADILRDLAAIHLWLNGERFELTPLLFCNGLPASQETVIYDRDVIAHRPQTVSEAIAQCLRYAPFSQLNVTVNGQPQTLAQPLYTLSPDVGLDTAITDGLRLSVRPLASQPILVRDALNSARIELAEPLLITLNGLTHPVAPTESQILRNGETCSQSDLLQEGDVIDCPSARNKPALLTMSSLLLQMGAAFRLQATGKERLVLRKNGLPADFSTPIAHGDEVEIFFTEFLPAAPKGDEPNQSER